MASPVVREWAMPSASTFSVPPIAAFVERWTKEASVIVDPFAGQSLVGTHRNDLAFGGVDAVRYLDQLIDAGVVADAVLLDPPYSPRQMSESYKNAGMKVGMSGTQNARLYRECKDRLTALLRPGGVALTFGWNSTGFGLKRGFRIEEILLVCHGGAHNDTICMAERLEEVRNG